jgi:hypothetical protein
VIRRLWACAAILPLTACTVLWSQVDDVRVVGPSAPDATTDTGADVTIEAGIDAALDAPAEARPDADAADAATACTTLLALRPTTYPAGINSAGLAAARLNGDALFDIVVTNRSFTTKAGVLLNTGGAAFGASTQYTTTVNPNEVAVGDMDNDTKLDLVVSGADNPNQCAISVLRGNGDGTFQAKQDAVAGVGTGAIALGRVDADNDLDVLVLNFTDETVGIFLGNGDGTLQAQSTVATGPGPTGIALGHLNAGTALDLVVRNAGDSTLSVRLGNGDGTFGAKQDHPAGAGPGPVALVDLDGDGKIDIVTANGAASSISVLRGNGDGTFQTKADYATSQQPLDMALGDVDGDGKIDVVVTVPATGVIDVLRGNGDGSFKAPLVFAMPASRLGIRAVIEDFNGDGRKDVVVLSDADSLVVFTNACP